jgi:hypothetical protein
MTAPDWRAVGSTCVEPARSLLLLKPTMTIGHGGGERLTAGSLEYKVLSEWIAAGGAAPVESDPRITALEVDTATADAGDRGERGSCTSSPATATAIARTSPAGSSIDGANAAVAAVDDDGAIRVAGPGETAISLWYQSNVAFARVTNPHPRKIAGGGLREFAAPATLSTIWF